jgi:hypothetical protein
MALDSRITKLLPALSVHERAVLCLRAQNAGEETTELTRSMPQEQRHQFNRYMGLAFVAGCQFGSLVHVIASQIDDLRFDIERFSLLEQAATMLEEDYPDDIAREPVRPWSQVQRSKRRVSVPTFLRSLGESVREDAFDELFLRWQELRAVEVVTDEIAASFDGEDPLHPEVRQKLQTCVESVHETNALLSRGKPRSLPGPDDGHLGRTRDLIDQAFHVFGFVEE